MQRFWLAGALAVVAASGVSRADARDDPLSIVGMGKRDVGKLLGKPVFERRLCASYASIPGPSVYERTDWLGGREKWCICWNMDGTVQSYYLLEYRPLSARPPWLDRLLQVFTWVASVTSP
jgi:hypothetical protein